MVDNINPEQWQDIPWYEGIYQASNKWRIKSLKRKNVISDRLIKWYDTYWYNVVNLTKNWKVNNVKIHRLVMLSFRWPSDLHVNHINWIKNDNDLSNLEYCTASENLIHSYKHLWRTNPSTWKLWWLSWNSKWVSQYTIQWKLIKEWWWMNEAAKKAWVWQGWISLCCMGKQLTAGWFKWKYTNS